MKLATPSGVKVWCRYMTVIMMHGDAFTSILLHFQEVDKINAHMYFSSVIISARHFSVNYGLVVKAQAVSLHVKRHGWEVDL